MVLPQNLQVYPGPVVISFGKSFCHNLYQVVVPEIALCKKHQMIIPVASASPRLLVKPGARRHIDLASKDWLDPCLLGCLIEVDHPVHNPVVRDRHAVHAQFPDLRDTLADFI